MESLERKISNTVMARALREFLPVSNLSDNLRRECIPSDAPRWHNACN
jgi:Mg-chelatase subunit ChlI